MLFNSFDFLVFLAIVFFAYHGLRAHRARLWLLFGSSCVFYGYFIPKYLLILFVVIAIDFIAGQRIGAARSAVRRRTFLLVSLAANIGILAVFKYANFLIGNWNELARFLHWGYSVRTLQIVLPIGLSFHTFQSMSYILEVYAGRYEPERDWLTYSVYVLYFPQLVAGPIERPQNVLPQLHAPRAFTERDGVSALFLIAQGLLKKCVVADSLSPLVARVYATPADFGLAATALGMIAFSFQIYCDFSGYSDIARGTSRLFGIELMRNFRKPYFSVSVGEFWRRWHISLSTWFRDYLFIPLGGSRGSAARNNVNLLLVFMVSGLWHGANWTFIAWGALHGLCLILENRLLRPCLGLDRWPRTLGHAYVFVLVSIAWVFFRAPNFQSAATLLNGLVRPFSDGWSSLPSTVILECAGAIAALIAIESLDERRPVWESVARLETPWRWAFYWGIVAVFLLTGQFSGMQFIYFQF